MTKKFLPGLYELPGGHIEYGENIVEGLKREVLEELGMRISVGDAFTHWTTSMKKRFAFRVDHLFRQVSRRY